MEYKTDVLMQGVALRGSKSTDDFLNTDDFRRRLIQFIHPSYLLTMRQISKEWSAVVEGCVDNGFKRRSLKLHDGKGLVGSEAEARQARREKLTMVIFLLNITKIGEYACFMAFNLVVVDIPEGVDSICHNAFMHCSGLASISFPTTLRSVGVSAFHGCRRLENVHLLHTNLRELGQLAFNGCSNLISMTIPESREISLGSNVFFRCYKLIPRNVNHFDNQSVLDHLRQQNR